MNARHILYIAPFGLRHKTTVWARTLPLARELVRQGFRCTILVPPWDAPEDGGRRENRDGVEIVQINVEGGLPAMVARLVREVQMRRPDVVQCIKPRAYAGMLQWLLWQQRERTGKGPAIWLDLDDWEQAWQEVNHYPPPVARFLAWQEEWGIRHADAITVASRWLEARARAYAPSTPVLYLPNGVDLPPGSLTASLTASPTGAPPASLSRSGGLAGATVLHFTRFVEVAPLWFAAYALALAKRAPEARIIVAGSPLRVGGDAIFHETVAAANLQNVTWLGYLPAPVLPALYAASDVAIFPAAATILQEAKCSVRLATTLLGGVPVVASAVGEQSQYGDAGSALLLPANATPAQFADATVALLADAGARAQMIVNARRHLAETYQWAQLGATYGEFLGRSL